MKIQSSDILLSSRTQFSRTTEKKQFTLDENKNIRHRSQRNSTEQRHGTASTSSHTGADYTVEIREEAKGETVLHTEESPNSSPNLNDNFERNMYLSSVLSWVADTMDKFVAALEEKESSLQEHGAQRSERTSGNPTASFLSKGTASLTVRNNNPGKKRFEFLRTMAAEFRAKADALHPVNPEENANQKISTTQLETERTIVKTSGLIQTTDGREIGFSLDIDMHRESQSKTVETFRYIDPLVINFSGTAAQLSDEKRSFDLNNDGIAEEIAQLQSGSGFLALDLNGDGIINHGGELFGPSTGDGFQELTLFDDDNNRWIDENDEIYKKLEVWIKDSSGNDVLKKLSEAGIGAIHLGSVDSGFSLKNTANETLGQVVSTGIAITEKGEIKTIQQIDLVV
ncbi:MAG: hypothetical protein JEZ12_01845 [Desulfobacterium sp.]|nr:hypothetical protein [Desulfobacterium sp.]